MSNWRLVLVSRWRISVLSLLVLAATLPVVNVGFLPKEKPPESFLEDSPSSAFLVLGSSAFPKSPPGFPKRPPNSPSFFEDGAEDGRLDDVVDEAPGGEILTFFVQRAQWLRYHSESAGRYVFPHFGQMRLSSSSPSSSSSSEEEESSSPTTLRLGAAWALELRASKLATAAGTIPGGGAVGDLAAGGTVRSFPYRGSRAVPALLLSVDLEVAASPLASSSSEHPADPRLSSIAASSSSSAMIFFASSNTAALRSLYAAEAPGTVDRGDAKSPLPKEAVAPERKT